MLDDPQEGAAAETPAEGSPSPESGVMLTLTSSSSSLDEDDLFEPVSLRDLDLEGIVPDFTIADASIRSSLDSAGELNVIEALSNELHVDQNFYSQQFKPSSSTASFDSYSYASSSVGSPPKPKVRQPTMPDIPPELVHLVDSVIMGSSESMEKLKLMVSGDESLELSRPVVDALLATMGGVEGLDEMDGTGFEDSTPSVMLTSRAAVVAAELIPCLPGEGDSEYCMSARTRMAKGLLLILNACTKNRVMCSGSGLLGVLLDSTEKIVLDPTDRVRWNAWPLFNCLQVLGGHSLSVVDLERWLILIKKSLVTELAMPLMMSLENVICSEESRGPACTFEFDGENSGLLTPGESRWPFSNGYAFVTWIYMELLEEVRVPPNINTTVTSAAANSGRSSPVAAVGATGPSELVGQVSTQIPRIFSFVSSDNHWIEAYFYGQFLAVEVCDGKGKKSSIRFNYEFKPQCWYFLGLEHSYKQSLLGKAESEVRLYVDGSLHETRPFELVRTSKQLSFCSIGTNPPPTLPGLQRRKRQCALFGEMGPIYIFKEPIGPDKMTRLALRGGDVLPSFGKGAGSLCLAVNEHIRSLAEASSKLDADVGGSLHLLYHPNLLNNRFCQDASPFFSTGIHQRHAEVLGQVHVASRARPAESLWALAYGGPMALLPMIVSDVHMDNLEPKFGDPCLALASYSLSASVFRIISMAIHYPGNNEELCRTRAPELLSRILYYLLTSRSNPELRNQIRLGDEDLVSAVALLCQSQKNNHPLKVQLFRTLLLDLKMWGLCNYGLQKKLLSSLADMVFSESSAMRDANALQVLLDGCRRCYWIIHEKDSIDTFSLNGRPQPAGEVNALVDELLVVIELLMGAANPSLANQDVRCLLCFLADCPQPNQVARVLHLIYRLVVQPNASRAKMFSNFFISCGGVETLLFLLQQEAKKGNQDVVDNYRSLYTGNALKEDSPFESMSFKGRAQITQPEFLEKEAVSREVCLQPDSIVSGSGSVNVSSAVNNGRISGSHILKSFGGIRFSLNSESSRSNVFNIDNGDGIVVAIISLLGSLLSLGYLKFNSNASSSSSSNGFLSHRQYEDGSTMFDDKVSLLLFALQKALQAAPQRLMTTNVQMAFLVASINISSLEDGLNIYGSGHCLEHFQLLVVLLRALPHASCAFQMHTIQDLLFLACSHPENRSRLTSMAEWPEWILEVLISNCEMAPRMDLSGVSIEEIEDLIHNFLIIVLEYSMRKKDGWKDVEATIHCAEWLSMIGGSSTGEQRMRREEVLPIFKRRLLASLLDFAAWELQAQTQVIAAAAAGVSKASPQKARAEAENAAQLSVALAENAIVVLMLVEDHLRLQGQQFLSSNPSNLARPSVSVSSADHSYSISRDASDTESFDLIGSTRTSLSKRAGSVLFEALASVADENGEVPATVMERFTVAAAAEPYESVRCAFVSYGSCILDLAESWKSRSRMWYGIELPSDGTFGGGASGWNSWKSVLEKDSNGKWIELPLVNKSIVMLQSLLLDESGIGGGLGIGSGSGTGMGGITALYHLLDSEQPFLCMLRMILLSMREDDDGEYAILARNTSINDGMLDGTIFQAGNGKFLSHNNQLLMKKSRSALLWSVLGPILNMPISESKRQRVLVACSVMYSEVWLAIGRDKKPMRKNYLESILPPFIAVLRRWRPILATIHELTSSEVENPFTADDHALSADALPLEAALAMISPRWSAVFASPPAALALAMIAAGASGGETNPPPRNAPYRRETSLLERSTAKLHTFSSFQKPLETSSKSPPLPKDKAAAKAAALAAARDLERSAKIGTGRGLCAVAMATSAQRRSSSDHERVKMWNIAEAMGAAWTECLQPFASRSVSGLDFSALCYKYVAVLVNSFAVARNMQRLEMERHVQVDFLDRHCVRTGTRAWRKLIGSLLEMNLLFGPFGDHLGTAKAEFWKLDMTEGSSRMRRFLKRNYKSSYLNRVPYDEDKVHLKPRVETDDHGDLLTSVLKYSATILTPDAMSLEGEHNNYDQPGCGILLDVKNQYISNFDEYGALFCQNPAASVHQNLVQPSAGLAPGYVSCEADERIILELPSLMVRPLKVVSGTFQITTKRINFIVGGLTSDESIIDGFAASAYETFCDKDRSWSILSLRQVFCRRYLLRRSALELFMADRSNFLFDFGTIEGCKNAFRAIVQAHPPHMHNEFIAIQRPEEFIKRTQLTERWARWEISNFEYLMELNTLSGRSYNDITQYPIFPWVLADYCSKILNLEEPSSYRDLSKPIGALNTDRLRKFQDSYSNIDDPIIPKFHYSTYYSSAKTTLYFLVRLEPFTTLSTKFLGDSFSHDAHMFSDISDTWNNVLEDIGDLKELVPEMFYLPEILANVNNIDLGATELQKRLDSVKLPPWADNPIDFVQKHRRALESVHVSSHLHEWIDLIFGYKQRGKEAVSANNVFFYTTYEGMVDIDRISDPVQRSAARREIAYFGQAPSQLFTFPHLKRKPLTEALHLQTIFRNPEEIRAYETPYSERSKMPASCIYASDDSVIVVSAHAPAANVALCKWKPNTPDDHGNPFLFHYAKTAVSSGGGALTRMFKGPTGTSSEESHFSRAVAFAAPGIRSSCIVAVTTDNEIITGGHVDNSIKMISADGARTIETASGHCAPVTCLALSPDGTYLATGSRDTTVILWRIHRISPSNLAKVLETSSVSPMTPTSPVTGGSNFNDASQNKHKSRIEGPMHVLRGHRGEVICCSVNSDIGIIASSSSSSGVLLHSLRRGRLLRKLDNLEARALCISSTGALLIWNDLEKKLCTYYINGTHIATAILSPFSGQISCIEISADGQYALIGSSSCNDGQYPLAGSSCRKHVKENGESSIKANLSESDSSNKIFLRSYSNKPTENRLFIPIPSICFLNLLSLKVFHTLTLGEGQDITSFALSKDNKNLLVSTADRKLIVFTDPSLSLKKIEGDDTLKS